MYDNTYLQHHGIKGQKWGVRRFQNADGTLTSEGVKRYRKDYDKIKGLQISADDFKQHTGVSFIDKYNQKYYNDKAKAQIEVLLKKIGDKGYSQIDQEVIKEGEKYADKLRKEAEDFNKAMGNEFMDTKRVYDDSYNRYMKNYRVNR